MAIIQHLRLPAPAKLNLMLHITGRRDDGYHELETIFQLLDIGDELSFDAANHHEIRLTGNMSGVPHSDNLIVKAAQKLQAIANTKANATQGINIHIDKRLPMGGGIGGGSSDAATCLLALNMMWQLNLTLDQLAKIGLSLGADVPLFVRGRSAFATGIGEKLTPIELPQRWFLVVTPNIHISTPKIFSHPRLTRDSSPSKMALLIKEGGRNDCLAVVKTLYPEMVNIHQKLNEFGDFKLTGTGASFFSVFDEQEELAKCFKNVLNCAPSNWQLNAAKGLNQSSVHQTLEQKFNWGVAKR